MKTKKMMALVATGLALAAVSGASADTVVVNGEVIKDAIVVRNGIIVMNGAPEPVDLVHLHLLHSYVRDKTVVVYGPSIPLHLLPPRGYVMNKDGYIYRELMNQTSPVRFPGSQPVSMKRNDYFPRYTSAHARRLLWEKTPQYNPAASRVTTEVDKKNHPTRQ